MPKPRSPTAERVHLTLPRTLFERIEKMAKEKGYMSWTEFARLLLIHAIEKEEKTRSKL